ncbi:MAG: hypothetical protein WA705_01040 [Candidatus Ozemobacteraceae bacterium]
MKMNLRFHGLIFACIFAFSFLSFPAIAANPVNGVGTVDGRLLLMFHPMMANFDYTNGRFYRSESLTRDINVILSALQKAQAEANKSLQGLTAKETALDKRRQDLIIRREEVINDLLSKAASATYQVRDKGEKVEEFESRYAFQLSQLDAQLKQIRKDIIKAQEAAMASIFLTSEETDKRMEYIRAEVQAFIAQAATEYGIGIVIDNTYGMSSQNRAAENAQIPTIEESVDVVSSALFHSFSNLVIDPQVKANLQMPPGTASPEDHMVAGRSVGLADNLKQYLEFRHYMPEKLAAFSPGKLFLVGGTDLTPWVARKIFARYKIPETLQKSFMILIRNYSDFEKVNY